MKAVETLKYLFASLVATVLRHMTLSCIEITSRFKTLTVERVLALPYDRSCLNIFYNSRDKCFSWVAVEV